VVREKSPLAFHCPARTYRSACGILRSTAMASPTARSATSSVRTSGVLVTRIPRSRHLARSTRSIPTEKEATISSAGRASMSLASAPWWALPTTARMEPAWVRRKSSRRSGGDSQKRMRRQRRSSCCSRYALTGCSISTLRDSMAAEREGVDEGRWLRTMRQRPAAEVSLCRVWWWVCSFVACGSSP
jgi:hypothetical protein